MNLALIGPSGVGKGTQIRKLISAFGMQQFCPGNLFREAIKNRTTMGLVAKRYLDRADLVPDDIVNGMLEEWLWATHPRASIVFDGYPRTPLQAIFLDEILQELERKLDAVILLQASDDILIGRLSGRRLCRVCPSEFHVGQKPFQICPYKRCQGEYLYQQTEDKPDVVGTRLGIFQRTIKPLVKHYQLSNKLIVVNADRDEDEVHNEIAQAVQALPP
jgi:adenylate kinase